MRRHATCVLIVAAILAASATGPADYNVPGQKRTRSAAAMKAATVPLRFADGTPTGFYARADDPSKDGDAGRPCAPGFMEMDAQEIITTGDGMRLLFHAGGGGGLYNDPIEDGQYGQVARDAV